MSKAHDLPSFYLFHHGIKYLMCRDILTHFILKKRGTNTRIECVFVWFYVFVDYVGRFWQM